jgi:hypothetical protein
MSRGFLAPLALLLICTVSCKKFLQENPKNVVSNTNYYTTQADAISAVNSIYAYLNSTSTGSTAGVYHSSFWVTAGLSSDEMLNQQLASPDLDQLANFTYSSQNATLQEIWTMHYKAITIANIAIGRIPGISMDTALRSRLVGEARFLRGLLYFNLIRMYGHIPMVLLETEPLTPTVAPTAAVYTQILSDLAAAENVLPYSYPPGNGRGRATKGAAMAIEAKVFLTLQQWQSAADKAMAVINSQQYALWDNFADVFKLSSRGGKEAIFSVGFGDANGAISFWEVGQFNVRLLPPDLSQEGVQNAQGWQVPTLQLYNSYDPQDNRRAVTFITQIRRQDGSVYTIRPYIQKYWDTVAEPTGNGSANDFPVIRYADVLLMYAEASNELGHAADAHTYINMVRKRARFNGTTYPAGAVPDYTGLNQADMRAALINERRLEFVAEGQRWFDLVRTNTLAQLVPLAKPGVTPAAKNVLFPIPQSEIDLNKNLTQNTGY